jgi:hypothetical protein
MKNDRQLQNDIEAKKSAELAVRRVAGVKTVILDIDVTAASAVPGPRTPRSVSRISEIA